MDMASEQPPVSGDMNLIIDNEVASDNVESLLILIC